MDARKAPAHRSGEGGVEGHPFDPEPKRPDFAIVGRVALSALAALRECGAGKEKDQSRRAHLASASPSVRAVGGGAHA